MLENIPEIEVPVVTVTKVTLSLAHFKEHVLFHILDLMKTPEVHQLDRHFQLMFFTTEELVSAEDAARLSQESYPAIISYLASTLCLPSLRLFGANKFAVNTADFNKSGMLRRMLVEYSATKEV